MTILDQIQNFLQAKDADEDAQITNGEIEDNIDREDKPFIGFYLEYRVHGRMTGSYHRPEIELPLTEATKVFTSIDEIVSHIKSHKRTERSQYFFDRNNEEVREAVLDAFKERRCEQLKREKQNAEETLKEKQEKLEELDYCE